MNSLISNWDLIKQLTRRDVLERYRGSIFGLLWSFLNPLLLLLIYLFVFSVVFQMRWQGAKGYAQFGTVLFSGLILHSFLAECIVRAPGLIVNNTQFVKKVVFPLDVLPVVAVITALFHLLISIIILLLAHFLSAWQLNWTLIFAPLVIFPLTLFGLGFSYFISSTTVFIRDLQQIMGVVVTMLLFLSPIFYSIDAVPPAARPFIYLNPLTVPISEFRNIILWGKMPNLILLGGYALVGGIIYFTGRWWFQRTRNVFADVL